MSYTFTNEEKMIWKHNNKIRRLELTVAELVTEVVVINSTIESIIRVLKILNDVSLPPSTDKQS